jgi:hypothetical protein
LAGFQHHQTTHIRFQLAVSGFLIMNGLTVQAQTFSDTVKTVHISPQLKEMIHFNGYMQKRSSKLSISDSIQFKGIHTVKRLTIKEFLRITQADAEKYLKVMEEIYKPLREEQQRIIDNANAQSSLKYDAALGYPDPLKMPTEMMNQNKHVEKTEDYIKARKEAEIMKKYKKLN